MYSIQFHDCTSSSELGYESNMRGTTPFEEIDHDACGVGFIAQLGSTGSREVVERALTALGRLAHRGGVDADGLSGDGAGVLLPIPKKFFRECAAQAGFELPETFGVGMVFLPRGKEKAAQNAITSLAKSARLRCLGWRDVPIDPSVLGPRAEATRPVIRQCFFALEDPQADLERLLWLLRKKVEVQDEPGTYFCSLSSRTIVYKGLLGPLQVRTFYPDLNHPRVIAPFAIFHQRYSTNTQPTWTLAQPFRFVAHNGEINTIGANRRWARMKDAALRRELILPPWFHSLEERVSDSASFDNALEATLHRGFTLPSAMLRMVPPAWESDAGMNSRLRAFLESQAHDQEPWDGPAALVFSDGRLVGAKLDRNGLRPMRYTVSTDGLLIAGSEAGLADFEGRPVAERRRLGPGEMFIVDPESGRIFRGEGVANLLGVPEHFKKSPARVNLTPTGKLAALPIRQPKKMASALGWTRDQFRILFEPLGLEGKEATWSMGDDAPPAFLSSQRRPLWDYCKQRFAQVTNPAIDSLREAHVMSLDVHLGTGIMAGSPVLDAGQIAELERLQDTPVHRVDCTYFAARGVKAAQAALERIRVKATVAARAHKGILLLSDRSADEKRATLPILLALAAVWRALIRAGSHDLPVVVESGQIVETHHVAMLIAAGASAVYPYLALDLAESLKSSGATNYRKAVEAGLRKVLARIGISTLASYRNSQLFETIGLDEAIHDQFFDDAAFALGGKSLQKILEDSLAQHFFALKDESPELQDAGLYRFRHDGERHANSPELVRRMHQYIQLPSAENYRNYSELAESREPSSIRDLLEIGPRTPIALEDVEPESSILARFSTQAMSLGALGPEAHRTLAIAMNRLGASSNTGEGGEDPDVYRVLPEAANRIKQVASARFGVTAEYLVRADELEIKMAQGSKPGEGGQLPASKVNAQIARLRHAVPGMSLISPPPHHDIYSIEDLAQLIYDLRAINPAARIGVKLVSGAGVGIIAAGVAKAGADVITISGFDGGTGASPLTSIKNTGLPWEVGLREAHCALLRSGFRRRVKLRVDGGFKFGRDVVIAALLGADEFGFGTAALLAMGCVMARQCHLNTCPAGIATQDEKLRTRFAGKPEMVMDYFRGVAGDVREIMAGMGVASLEEIRGKSDLLRPRNSELANSLRRLLEPAPELAPEHAIDFFGPVVEEFGLQQELGHAIQDPVSSNQRRYRFTIANSDRSVGANLSGQVLRNTVYLGFGEGAVDCEFRGVAGQSFGAFLISGIHFRLFGEANDYVGKGLSGGTIAITAGTEASERGDVLVGNTCLYGATSGELYVAGRAGERFAVRNSGGLAVVEGAGEHACEYMTAGIVLILGPAGRNLGAGMTGGLTYVLRDAFEEAEYHREFVRPNEIGGVEEDWLRYTLREHTRQTGSPLARLLLRSASPLPLLRLEPVKVPAAIVEIWAPVLKRWEERKEAAIQLVNPVTAEEFNATSETIN
jgi:glutamate synthase (ferredoxin)